MRLTGIKLLLTMAMLLLAMASYAEDAPVYDVDNYPPAFEGQSDLGGDSTGNSLPQRVTRAEQQLNNLQSQNANAKITGLVAEIQALRGQVEILTHQLEQIQNQQKSHYTDLDSRLNQLQTPATKNNPRDDKLPLDPKEPLQPLVKGKAEAKKPVPIKAETQQVNVTNDSAQPNSVEEQKIYQTAYDAIKAQKYQQAITALQAMLKKYPSGQFAANAHYWLGELFSILNKNDSAAIEYGLVVKNFPNSPKVADAQLKLGLIYAGQFKWPQAKSALKQVMSDYPGTASAKLAKEQLKSIQQLGH